MSQLGGDDGGGGGGGGGSAFSFGVLVALVPGAPTQASPQISRKKGSTYLRLYFQNKL